VSKENALRKAAIAAHIVKVASQEKEKALRELREYMAPGDTSKPMIDGLQVGTVSFSSPQPRYQVVDEKALVAWLEWNKPEAVHKVPAPWFTATAALDGFIKQTGEVPDGVEVVRGAPSISVRVSAKQAEAIRDLISTGDISLLEIEGGDA
jgi:hypothetical protein